MILSIPDKNSDSNAWINFHKRMRAKFSTKKADQIWVEAWLKRGNPKANNEQLRDYMKRKKITIEADFSDQLEDPFGIFSLFGDITQAAKITIFITVGIVLLFLLMLAINPFKTLKAASMLTPAGRLKAL